MQNLDHILNAIGIIIVNGDAVVILNRTFTGDHLGKVLHPRVDSNKIKILGRKIGGCSPLCADLHGGVRQLRFLP